MKLAVGDAVVYAAHGVGRVAALERRAVLGVEQDVVVLELGLGLWVTLSTEHAHERLRLVANEADVQRVQQTLRDDGEAGDLEGAPELGPPYMKEPGQQSCDGYVRHQTHAILAWEGFFWHQTHRIGTS